MSFDDRSGPARTQIDLRRVTEEDLAILQEWALSDPAGALRVTLLETPERWLEMQSVNRQTYMVESDGGPIGMLDVEVDTLALTASIAYYVHTSMRGRGMAQAIIERCVDIMTARGLRAIEAWIEFDNYPSAKAAERAGFHFTGEEDDGIGLWSNIITG